MFIGYLNYTFIDGLLRVHGEAMLPTAIPSSGISCPKTYMSNCPLELLSNVLQLSPEIRLSVSPLKPALSLYVSSRKLQTLQPPCSVHLVGPQSLSTQLP